MSYRSILVHLDDSPRCNVRIDLAAQIAEAQGGHLLGLAPTGWVDMPASVGHAVGGTKDIQLSFEHLVQRAHRVSAAFTGHLAGRAGVSFESRVHEGDPTIATIRMARCCDLAVIGQTEDDASASVPYDFPQQVVLGAGVPVLVVPYAGRFDAVGRRVLVAWDGSREAARGLNASLPLLVQGAKVQAIVFDHRSSAEDVQGWQLEQLRQPAQLGVAGDLGVDRRRRHADRAAEPVHAHLVIDDGVARPRVVVEDARGVAPVHAEDAQVFQTPATE